MGVKALMPQPLEKIFFCGFIPIVYNRCCAFGVIAREENIPRVKISHKGLFRNVEWKHLFAVELQRIKCYAGYSNTSIKYIIIFQHSDRVQRGGMFFSFYFPLSLLPLSLLYLPLHPALLYNFFLYKKISGHGSLHFVVNLLLTNFKVIETVSAVEKARSVRPYTSIVGCTLNIYIGGGWFNINIKYMYYHNIGILRLF